jgi:serine/threonine protein kinase
MFAKPFFICLYLCVSFLERSDGVSIAAVKNWLYQILEAIRFLHEKGIAHRNLRLSCIYYEGTVEGRVKIGDLGSAKAIGASAKKGTYKGTAFFHVVCISWVGCVNYMAPEYYGDNGYQWEVDIWGFGMCVIEMATLAIPYSEEFGNSVDAIKEAVRNVCCFLCP